MAVNHPNPGVQPEDKGYLCCHISLSVVSLSPPSATCYHGVLDCAHSFKQLANQVGYIIVIALVAVNLWQWLMLLLHMETLYLVKIY